MINYTERLSLLMEDIVGRVPTLSFIDMSKVLVFGRAGRTNAEGAYATCHCVCLPPSEPGYYFWRDRTSGTVTRRSEWFVTKSPSLHIGTHPIDYMISFTLPRFCDQTLARSKKQVHYRGEGPWIGKLDTVVHELYHIDPSGAGIRRMERADGTYSANCHGGPFFEHVVDMVKTYLATKPDPATYDFLHHNHEALCEQYGRVVGQTFKAFPSFPQRYTEVVSPQPAPPEIDARVEPLKVPRVTTSYTEKDLTIREFTPRSSRRLLQAADADNARLPVAGCETLDAHAAA